MSQVLKALKQSQKQYEQMSTLTSLPGLPHRSQSGRGKTRLMIAVAVGLALGVVGHVTLSHSQLTEGIKKGITSPLNDLLIDDSASLRQVVSVKQSTLDVTFLPAKPAQELIPLPKIEPEIVNVPSRFKPQPEMIVDEKPLPRQIKTEGEWNLPELDLSGLSPELASSVASVLDNPSEYQVEEINEEPLNNSQLVELDKESERFRGRLPALNLQTHMYASNPKHRWVKINGSELQEGDRFDDEVQIVEIAPRYIVIEFSGEKIEIPALYDWQG